MHDPAGDASLARQEQDEIESEVARVEGDADEAGDPTETILVQVVAVSGTTFPTSPHAVYPAQRAEVTVTAERVGATVTITPIGDWFPVAHVGPVAPSVGDNLFATRLDGLWVTRKALA